MKQFIKEVKLIYLKSRKKDQYLIARISRPFASFFLYFVKDTRITPNQITLLSVIIAFFAAIVLIFVPIYTGSIIAALILQLAFVFDCADGQLARLRGQNQAIGELIDELSGALMTFLIFVATSIYLYQAHNNVFFLLIGIVGLFFISTGYALNMFVRQKEYESEWEKRRNARLARMNAGRITRYIAELRFFLVHFPSYFLILAIINKLEWYLYVNTFMWFLICGKRMLEIAPRLFKFDTKSVASRKEKL